MLSMANRALRLMTAGIVPFLTGCVALTSELRDEGVVYYLPKSILTITVREYHDTKAGRKWYQIGGEGKRIKPDGTEENSRSPAIIVDETVPDPKFRYAIKYRPSAFHDDRLCITRKPDGLLNDVIFASDDRTPELAFNVARFVAGAMPKPAGFTGQENVGGDATLVSRGFTGRVDPFDDESIFIFNQALKRAFGSRAGVEIDFHRMRHDIADSRKTWPEDCKARRSCPAQNWTNRCGPGQICYRTKLRLPVELKQFGQTVDMNYANMVNVEDIGAVSVERAFLVHKLTKLRFQEGALIAAVIRKPSEVEETSLLPLHVLNAALSVPSGLFAQAFSGAATNQQLIKDMAELTTEVKKLSDAQTALRNSIATGAEPFATNDAANNGQFSIDCLDPTGSRKGIPLNVIQ